MVIAAVMCVCVVLFANPLASAVVSASSADAAVEVLLRGASSDAVTVTATERTCLAETLRRNRTFARKLVRVGEVRDLGRIERQQAYGILATCAPMRLGAAAVEAFYDVSLPTTEPMTLSDESYRCVGTDTRAMNLVSGSLRSPNAEVVPAMASLYGCAPEVVLDALAAHLDLSTEAAQCLVGQLGDFNNLAPEVAKIALRPGTARATSALQHVITTRCS
jgi:hypothetical protein